MWTAAINFPPAAMPERLLAILLQALEREPAATSGPDRTLPARYRKGTPLHWELPRRMNPAELDER